MGHPDMKCMHVNIWVHHMQIDELFDFLNGRIESAPPYWLNEQATPFSVTGGYAMISLPYDLYSELRFNRSWDQK